MTPPPPLSEQLLISSLPSLLPPALLSASLRVEQGCLTLLQDPPLSLPIPSQGLHLAGAGKAVLGLASHLVGLLGDQVRGGLLSVPVGTGATGDREHQQVVACREAGVKVVEGASSNLPDAASREAASRIASIARGLGEGDLLLLLLSGGGSALLPLPRPGLSLEEKTEVVRQVSRAGATIHQLNTVRKALSGVKGGRLAAMAAPATVLTLVLSDVIGGTWGGGVARVRTWGGGVARVRTWKGGVARVRTWGGGVARVRTGAGCSPPQ